MMTGGGPTIEDITLIIMMIVRALIIVITVITMIMINTIIVEIGAIATTMMTMKWKISNDA